MGLCVSAKVLPFRVKFRSRDVFGRGGARGALMNEVGIVPIIVVSSSEAPPDCRRLQL